MIAQASIPLRNSPKTVEAPSPLGSRLLHRKCACGGSPGASGECEACRRRKMSLQRQAWSAATPQGIPPIVHEVLRSPGSPLDQGTRAFMEPRFGHDFGQVRVHSDARAADSAQTVNALAYTVGRDIVFAPGRYTPGTGDGRRLLAHELTHVVQQNHADSLAVQAEGIAPVDHPSEREADQVAEWVMADQPISFPTVGLIPGGTISRQTPTGSAPTAAPTTTPATATPTTGTCAPQDVADNVSEALTWLDDIYGQLLDFEVDEVFSTPGTPPTADHQRIAAALQQAFNTTSLSYVGVIRRRFLHIATMLRQPGRLTITCGGTFCSAGGTTITVAFVERPYALTLCNPGTPGSRPTATFIHEVGHAVVPQIGIRNTLTAPGDGIRDRAYTDERVFHHLSPEETLDNAESYGLLADLLHSRVNRQVVATQQDTTPGCANPQPVLHAFARAEQWNRYTRSQLDAWLSFVGTNALTTLPAADLALIQASFPLITTTAQLRDLFNAYDQLVSHGFGVTSWELGCATAGTSCPSGRLGYTYTGSVTGNSVALATISTLLPINLCPEWFSASFDDQVRSIYALFLIGRPAWIVAGFQLANAYTYIDFAREIVNSRAPAPTTTHAFEHDLRDAPTAPLPTSPTTPGTGP